MSTQTAKQEELDPRFDPRPRIQKLKPNAVSTIRKTVAVISGKGRVGKSLVTSLLAAALAKKGHKVGILDADVTGPSIPEAFGLNDYRAEGDGSGIFPARSALGVEIISAANLLEKNSDPLVWRGPLISNLVSQLYTQVNYGELEFLLIDMPPGTGDVPLTVFQELPIDGVIVVSSPQELVSQVVEKSVNMAKMMAIPILGLVENMAYLKCPHCGERIALFGAKDLPGEANRFGVSLLAEIPLDPHLASLVDSGKIEDFDASMLANAVAVLEKL